MKRWIAIIACAAFFLGGPAAADQLTFEQVKQGNGAKLSADELRTLIPGSKYQLSAGKVETTWLHTPDGKLTGQRTVSGGRTNRGNRSRNGTWRITDDGTYCVDIAGDTPDDMMKWCRHVYKLNGAYYGFEPDAGADVARRGFELRK